MITPLLAALISTRREAVDGWRGDGVWQEAAAMEECAIDTSIEGACCERPTVSDDNARRQRLRYGRPRCRRGVDWLCCGTERPCRDLQR